MRIGTTATHVHALIAIVLSLAAVSVAAAAVADFPVVLTGQDLPGLSGRPVGEIYVFTYDAGADAWTRIAHQVDEVKVQPLKPSSQCGGVAVQAPKPSHPQYIDSGTEGNGFDDDDELVFMIGDGSGDQAPTTSWVAGTDNDRFEVEIRDGSGALVGHAYVYTAAGAPPAPAPPDDDVDLQYMDLDGILEDTWVTSSLYRLNYGARWRLNVATSEPANGGSGADLIDRIKRRAYQDIGGETEEFWDATSCFLAQKDGPVRVLRSVQGAASGPYTVLTTRFYGARWVETVHLRVHAITMISTYLDLESGVTPATLYNPSNPSGVPVDGVADAFNTQLAMWGLYSTPGDGSLLVHWNETVPPPAQSTLQYYLDDASYPDDSTDSDPGHYGAYGLEYRNILDTNPSAAVMDLTLVPLPSGAAFADGDALASEIENPPTASTTQQACSGPACGGSGCGNGICDAGEDECNCAADCGAPPATETVCDDGLDDDCDTLVDCADPDCDGTPPCPTGPVCGNGVCEPGEDCTTCSDCPGKDKGKPANRYCCGNGIAEAAEGDGTICDGNY